MPSLKMEKRCFVLAFSIIYLMAIVSAVTLSPTSMSLDMQPGNSVERIIQVSTDSNITQTILVSKGAYASWFSLDDYEFDIIDTSPATRIITITIPQEISSGIYTLNPQFNVLGYIDGPVETITINVTNPQQEPEPSSPDCIIDIFPTILTGIKIQQGEIKTRNIQLNVPNCYTSSVNIQGVALSTDEKPLQLGELSLGVIQPGSSIQIPIEINAQGVSTGQYSDTLQFLLYNSSGEKINVPSVSISVLVTVGVSPITNFSLDQVPSCSLDAIEMNLNSSYKLTCTSVNPNIEILPIVNREIIQGVTVQEPPSQYIWEFKPINIGTTTIIAEFRYLNAPIGQEFKQEVRISYSGSTPVSGTEMKFEFIPNLENAQDGDTIIVHAVDNKTNSYITNAKLYLDGLEINDSFIIKAQKTYSLRAVAIGYLDYVEEIYVNPQVIAITLSPSSDFKENSPITVSTIPENASLFLNGVKLTENLIITSSGVHELTAIFEGYQETKSNITVSESVYLIANSTWRKGIQQVFILSNNASWQVFYAKNTNSQFNPIFSGNDDKVIFTPKDRGIYQIVVDGQVKYTNEIKGWNWNKKWLWFAWYWWIVAPFVVFVFILIIRRKRGSSIGTFTDTGETTVETSPPM